MPWVVIAVLLFVVSGLIYQTTLMDHEADITPKQKSQLNEIAIEITALKANWQSEVDDLKAIERGLDKNSESFRLTRLLTSTFSGFIRDASYLEKGLKTVEDTVGYFFISNEMADIKQAWQGSKRLLREHKSLLSTFSLMSDYKIKVDSLKELLSNEFNRSRLNQNQLIKAEKEIERFESELTRLRQETKEIESNNDSLLSLVNYQSLLIDSLTYSLAEQRIAFEKIRKEALLNGELANRLTLWYEENLGKNRVQRHLLSSQKNEFNKGADMKTIFAEFSLEAELYVPNEVSEVVMYNITNGQKAEIARTRVSVRRQRSGEFSLISNDKLTKGQYKVEVEYNNQIVLEQDFYIAK